MRNISDFTTLKAFESSVYFSLPCNFEFNPYYITYVEEKLKNALDNEEQFHNWTIPTQKTLKDYMLLIDMFISIIEVGTINGPFLSHQVSIDDIKNINHLSIEHLLNIAKRDGEKFRNVCKISSGGILSGSCDDNLDKLCSFLTSFLEFVKSSEVDLRYFINMAVERRIILERDRRHGYVK